MAILPRQAVNKYFGHIGRETKQSKKTPFCLSIEGNSNVKSSRCEAPHKITLTAPRSWSLLSQAHKLHSHSNWSRIRSASTGALRHPTTISLSMWYHKVHHVIIHDHRIHTLSSRDARARVAINIIVWDCGALLLLLLPGRTSTASNTRGQYPY